MGLLRVPTKAGAAALAALALAGCGTPPAPAFELKSLKGDTVTLSALRGHPVFLYFWASWSPPARLGLAQVAKAQKGYADRVAFLAVAVADDPAAVGRAARVAGPGVQVLLGDEGIVRNYFGGGDPSLPLALLLDGRGRVVARLGGYQAAEDLAAALDKALGAPDAAAAH